jgi:hypothetical protein
MLQRQAGVVFFGFFYSVFFIMMTKSEKALSGVKKSKLANEGEG